MQRQSCAREESRAVILLFLHGSGDTGPSFRQYIETVISPEVLTPKGSVVLFPTARKQRYTPIRGEVSSVWFDRPRLHYDETEDSVSLAQSIHDLNQKLTEAMGSFEAEPSVVLAGFSMGGSMALHLAFGLLEKGRNVCGVFVHSSFIGRHSNAIPRAASIPSPVWHRGKPALVVSLVHGSDDTKVPCEWGRMTADRLRDKGFNVDFNEVEGLRHEISGHSICFLRDLIHSKCSNS